MLGKCPICHELFENAGEASVVQCGHVFHHHCILNWLERGKTCPSCRKPASPASLIRQIFVDFEDSFLDDKQKNCALCPTHINERDDWILKYSELKRSSDEQLKKKDKELKDMERSLKAIKNKVAKREAAILALQTQAAESESTRKELEMVKAEAKSDRYLPQFISTLKVAQENLKEMREKLRNTKKELQETKKQLENREKLSEELDSGAGEALYSPFNSQLRGLSPAGIYGRNPAKLTC